MKEEKAKRGRKGSVRGRASIRERVGSALEARSDASEEAGDKRARTRARVDSEALGGVLMPRCCAPGYRRRFPENTGFSRELPRERRPLRAPLFPGYSLIPGMVRAVVEGGVY